MTKWKTMPLAGRCCEYCRRLLTTSNPRSDRFATRDHMIPRSKAAGRANRVVPACLLCNNLKGDLMPEQWAAFCAAFPGWVTLGFRRRGGGGSAEAVRLVSRDGRAWYPEPIAEDWSIAF